MGTVNLTAEAEVNLKLNAVRFNGSLVAWAQRSVRVLVQLMALKPHFKRS